MIHRTTKIRQTIVLISLWTIVQTIPHIFWIIYAYLLSSCRIRPTYYDIVFVYLTYFYKQSCGPIHLEKDTLFLNRTVPEDDHFPKETASNVLYHFLNDTLHKATLPLQSNVVARTEIYLKILFITDVVWIVTAMCLCVGAFCKIRNKGMLFAMYGPWLLCSAFVNFLDVVSSVQNGIDLIYIRSYTSWLQFIGVTNYDDFNLFNDHPSSATIPKIPTMVMVSLLSRIFVVWLLNVICFFVILFLTIPDLFLKTTVRSGPRMTYPRSGKLNFDTGDELDLNSSEARIRNWQLFYGAIEANSTVASNSPGTSADHNSNSKSKEPTGPGNDCDMSANSTFDQRTNDSVADSGFKRFSDVANGVSKLSAVDTNYVNVPILKGHMPWSYISPEGQYVRKQHKYNTKPTRRSTENENKVTYCTRL